MYMRLRRAPMQPSRFHHALVTGGSKAVDRTQSQMCEPTQSRHHITRTEFCLANATRYYSPFFLFLFFSFVISERFLPAQSCHVSCRVVAGFPLLVLSRVVAHTWRFVVVPFSIPRTLRRL